MAKKQLEEARDQVGVALAGVNSLQAADREDLIARKELLQRAFDDNRELAGRLAALAESMLLLGQAVEDAGFPGQMDGVADVVKVGHEIINGLRERLGEYETNQGVALDKIGSAIGDVSGEVGKALEPRIEGLRGEVQQLVSKVDLTQTIAANTQSALQSLQARVDQFERSQGNEFKLLAAAVAEDGAAVSRAVQESESAIRAAMAEQQQQHAGALVRMGADLAAAAVKHEERFRRASRIAAAAIAVLIVLGVMMLWATLAPRP